ncbi:MAG TPA: TerB family tellurite resistance protein [Longimicrobiales bacterium]|nr:TerB family tellurite resistance protein [Longimicrobiales bacterium]
MSPRTREDPDAGAKDIRLAACALLLELAHADDELSEEERRHLEDAVRRQFDLEPAEAERLLALAEKERTQAVDLWQFTSLIADGYTLGQKMVLVEIMWGLVYSDGKLAAHESRLMRKISNLLRLEPGYLAEARKRFEQRPGRGASGEG